MSISVAPSYLGRPLVLPSGVTLPNRIAKAAMSEVLADPRSGAPGDRLVRLYDRWSRSGAGMLLTGNVMIAREGRGELGNVVVEDERHLPALRRWAEAAQAHGAHLWMQINHAGRQALKRVVRTPVAPSAIGVRGFAGAIARPRALEDAEIRALIVRYATTAAVARDAGFRGVQIHGAHGYLVSQFLSPLTNLRDDAWGGDPQRRMRFLLAIVEAMRAAVGPGFPIGVKLNSADFQRGGFEVGDAIEVVRALEAARVDLVEISGGNYESPAMTGSGELPGASQTRASSRAREAYFLAYAEQIRAATRLPLMLTGGMRRAATMDEVIASGAIDVVGLARPMAFDPDLPARLLSGESDAATTVKLRSRIRFVDDLLQIYWFQTQMHRMADGLEPDPGLGRWRVVLRTVRGMLGRSADRGRDRAALPGAVEAA